METIAIIDYEMGNLRSVEQAVRHVAQGGSFRVCVTDEPEQVFQADRIILPGQGAMPDCMQKLKTSGLHDAVLEAVRHKPLFGVCVGMQMLLDGSEEGASTQGVDALSLTPSLGLIAGKVRRFNLQGQLQEDGSRYKVPQMGWNQVKQNFPHPMWQGVENQAWFYFVHSYYAQLESEQYSAGETVYGARFTSVVARDNIFATQFHPEKSAEAGLQLYRNFLYWRP